MRFRPRLTECADMFGTHAPEPFGVSGSWDDVEHACMAGLMSHGECVSVSGTPPIRRSPESVHAELTSAAEQALGLGPDEQEVRLVVLPGRRTSRSVVRTER